MEHFLGRPGGNPYIAIGPAIISHTNAHKQDQHEKLLSNSRAICLRPPTVYITQSRATKPETEANNTRKKCTRPGNDPHCAHHQALQRESASQMEKTPL